MKKNLLSLTLLAFFAAHATAQITLPADSVPSLLCKKWTVSYALMGSTRIDMKPGVQAMEAARS